MGRSGEGRFRFLIKIRSLPKMMIHRKLAIAQHATHAGQHKPSSSFVSKFMMFPFHEYTGTHTHRHEIRPRRKCNVSMVRARVRCTSINMGPPVLGRNPYPCFFHSSHRLISAGLLFHIHLMLCILYVLRSASFFLPTVWWPIIHPPAGREQPC